MGSRTPRTYQTPAPGTAAPLGGNGPTAALEPSSQGVANLGEPECGGVRSS